jgi:hypothetical protein
VDHIRHRLLSMGGDAALYANSGLRTGLVPSLPSLCKAVVNCLQGLADAIRNNKGGESTTLTAAVSQVESELHALRESGATAPLALDYMLPFWSFVFNLMEIAESVVMLEAKSKALFNKDRGQ